MNGLSVRRFPVCRPRDPATSADGPATVFGNATFDQGRARWLESEGPGQPALDRPRPARQGRVRLLRVLQLPLLPRVSRRARGRRQGGARPDRRAGSARSACRSSRRFSGRARAMMYNSFEERAMIQGVAATIRCRASSSASDPKSPNARSRSRSGSKFNVKRPFAIYIGRIDENKGCAELFAFFERYAVMYPHGLDLILVGSRVLELPNIRGSVTSASSRTKTSSTRSRPRMRWSCRRGSKACRWWRWRHGRWANRSSPTAIATSCAARRFAATAASTMKTSRSSPRRCTCSKRPARSAPCSAATAASSSAGTTRGR